MREVHHTYPLDLGMCIWYDQVLHYPVNTQQSSPRMSIKSCVQGRELKLSGFTTYLRETAVRPRSSDAGMSGDSACGFASGLEELPLCYPCGNALQYASARLRRDREVVLKAVESTGSSLVYASDNLHNDREVVLQAVENEGRALFYASRSLCNDLGVVLQAVETDGQALQFASKNLRHDREVVLRAVKHSGMSLKFASETLRSDREIVLRAVERSGEAIQYASDDALFKDRKVVLVALHNCSFCSICSQIFQLTSPEPATDWEILAKVLEEDHRSRRTCNIAQEACGNATNPFHGERRFALAAVSLDGMMLRCVNSSLQEDHEVVSCCYPAEWAGLPSCCRGPHKK